MSTRPGLTIVIPAYNEAENIVATLQAVTTALAFLPLDAEIIVVDDGSTDDTARVVRAASTPDAAVTLLVNPHNMGFGSTYRRGVVAATREYTVMVHGDNAWGSATLRQLFAHVGEADVLVGYTRDMWRSRSWPRTVLSKLFTLSVNLSTGRRLRYYNGLQVHRTAVLKQLEIESNGYGFQAEVLVKALKLTRTFIEIPMDLQERRHGKSKALRPKNAVDVIRTLRRLSASEWRAIRS